MRIDLRPGNYIIAVSGGVDSIVLLDLLAETFASPSEPNDCYEFVVAHFDHGIRPDSGRDRMLVEQQAEKYGLSFVYKTVKLGAGASEELARNARYAFLEEVRKQKKATAIITAHHQDDVIETVFLNLVRGTGRKGLTSLVSKSGLVRPLLAYPKSYILTYAQEHQLSWNEDSTNQDRHYRRNYIRQVIMPRLDTETRSKLRNIIEEQQILDEQIDTTIINHLHLQSRTGAIDRKYFNLLPHEVAKEVLATWLREHGMRSFDAKTIERLVTGAKTAQPGKRLDIFHGRVLLIGKKDLALAVLER